MANVIKYEITKKDLRISPILSNVDNETCGIYLTRELPSRNLHGYKIISKTKKCLIAQKQINTNGEFKIIAFKVLGNRTNYLNLTKDILKLQQICKEQ